MAKIQFDLPTGDTEAVAPDSVGAFEKNFKLSKVKAYGQTSFSDNIYNKTMRTIVPNYKDYKDNKDDYQAFMSLDGTKKEQYIQALNDGLYTLDENKQVINGPSAPSWQKWGLLDKSALRGFLLAEANGFNPIGFDNIYTKLARDEEKRLSSIAIEDTTINTITGFLGSIAGIVGDRYLIPEIVGTIPAVRAGTIIGGMGKAMLQEAPFAFIGGAGRAFEKRKHIDHMVDELYTDMDMVKDIAIDTGAAALFRSFGSAIADNYTVWRGLKGITDETDRAIVTQFIKDKQFNLTPDTRTGKQILAKVADDIEMGKNTDVSDHVTVDINTRTSDDVVEISFTDELKREYEAKGYVEEEKILDGNIKAPEIADDVYGGMATKDDGDALIKEFATHPDIEAELKEIEDLETLLKDTGSEEFGKQVELMEESITKDTKFQTQEMIVGTETINKTDFDLIQARMKTREFNRKNPDNKKPIPKAQEDAYKRNENIADDLLDMEFIPGEKMPIFSKFADNLAAGTVAGIEEDEQGNITLNPEKFVAGLGGYTAAKAMFKAGVFDNLPQELNVQVKKYFGVELDSSIVPDVPGGTVQEKALVSDNITKTTSILTDNEIYKIKPTSTEFKGEITLLKNTEKAPYFGTKFAQDVEPSGVYAIQKETSHLDTLPNYETVKADIQKPLIIDITDDLTQWKRDLSTEYKAKGKALTKKLLKKGYDAIITTDKNGELGEIIILDTTIIKDK